MENDNSGDYIGYYVYGSSQSKHGMELNLQFQGSVVSGGGMDDVAAFGISGHLAGGDLTWTKSYATHDVNYQGCLEEDGRIFGTWTMPFGSQGGFMIWPRKGSSGNQRENSNAKPIEEEWLVAPQLFQPARKQ